MREEQKYEDEPYAKEEVDWQAQFQEIKAKLVEMNVKASESSKPITRESDLFKQYEQELAKVDKMEEHFSAEDVKADEERVMTDELKEMQRIYEK